MLLSVRHLVCLHAMAAGAAADNVISNIFIGKLLSLASKIPSEASASSGDATSRVVKLDPIANLCFAIVLMQVFFAVVGASGSV
ncbi:hypothetical protein HAX54_039895 [Datura stramonium]|uniref:Uncharacterized protein n=1 Tax=Datura stramonium TaxID=4076 RepID=A0ABS8SJM0_DATST|nr:hypothetical protein [Datura stramonium]